MWWGWAQPPQSSWVRTPGAPQTSELLGTHTRRLHRPQSSGAHTPGGSTDLRAPGRTYQEAPQTSELLGAHTRRLHRPQSSGAHAPGGSTDLRAPGRAHQEAPQTSELLGACTRRLHRPQNSWVHTPDGKTLAMGTQGNNCSVEHTFCPSYTNACSQIWSWEKSAAEAAQVPDCSATNLLPAATVPSSSAAA